MISVIVPVYQCEKYLSRCIDSILNQTFSDLEIVLIDDGSTDQSPRICDEYKKQDNRVKVVHQENKGVAAARNSGLDIAKGNYITFVDSDDYIEPDMYEQMMEKAIQYDCDVIMCDCVKDFPDKSQIYSHDIRAGYYSHIQLKSEYYPHLLIMENVEYPATISNWLLLFKKSLNKVRYVEGVRFSEDLLFGAQLLLYAKSFYYLKGKPYYHYVMNESSATHTFQKDKWNDYKVLYSAAEKFFLSHAKFDFRHQLDLMLLFFVYNAVEELSSTRRLSRLERKSLSNSILSDIQVKQMFYRLNILSLPISWKLKIITYLYKYRLLFIYSLIKKLT